MLLLRRPPGVSLSAQQTDKYGSQEMTLHPTWMAPCLETTALTPFPWDQTPRSSSGELLPPTGR